MSQRPFRRYILMCGLFGGELAADVIVGPVTPRFHDFAVGHAEVFQSLKRDAHPDSIFRCGHRIDRTAQGHCFRSLYGKLRSSVVRE